MSLFGTKYKAHGSISNSQIMPQRHYKDTYFGELVMMNAKTGDSVADNIRFDALSGITAHVRAYNKKGINKYGFKTNITFQKSKGESEKISAISARTGWNISEILQENTGMISRHEIAYATMSMNNNLHEESHGSGCVGRITINGVEQSIKSERVEPVTGVLVFDMCDGTVYSTGMKVEGGNNNIGSSFKSGYWAKVKVGSKAYFFYTADKSFAGSGGTSSSIDVMPIVSLQDNGNRELPYETLPWDDWEYKRRLKLLKTLNIDFADMSRSVFGYIPRFGSGRWNSTYGRQWKLTKRLRSKYKTEKEYYDYLAGEVNIPPFGSAKWKKDFARSYRSQMKICKKTNGRITDEQKKFCKDYPTERKYYDSLIKDQKEAAKNSKKITDVHFGFFVSAKTLDEANVAALYYTLEEILPRMYASENSNVDDSWKPTRPGGGPGGGVDIGNVISGRETYKFSIKQGSFDGEYRFSEWAMSRRYGVANKIRYPAGTNPKHGHTYYKVYEGGGPKFNAGDPIDRSFSKHRAPRKSTPGHMIELRIQDRPDASGRPRYLQMCLYNPTAKHKVDVLRDGEYGKKGAVVLTGSLNGYSKEDYSDVILYPITFNAFKKVKVFKRERLMRETMIIRVSAIQMEKIRWYQRGAFKVLMMVASLVLVYFFAPAGLALQAVMQAAVVMIIMQIVIMITDNPILQAIFQIIAIFYGGFNISSGFTFNPAMLVEAAGVMMQTKIALDAIKLQEEIDEFMEKMNKEKKKFEEMQKEVGNDEFNKDFMLYLAGLAPVENGDDWEKRVLNSELPETETKLPEVENKLPAPSKK